MYLFIFPNLSQKCDQLFREYVAGVSYVSCTICIICNKCICVFPQICPKSVTNHFVSMYHVYRMYHVPYVSYVRNVFVYFPKFVPKMWPTFSCVCSRSTNCSFAVLASMAPSTMLVTIFIEYYILMYLLRIHSSLSQLFQPFFMTCIVSCTICILCN